MFLSIQLILLAEKLIFEITHVLLKVGYIRMDQGILETMCPGPIQSGKQVQK